MTDSGRPTRNYALRGKVKYLCDEYPSLESLHRALSEGTDDLWGEKIASSDTQLSKPHFKLLRALDEDERFRELDVVFEYVIPGTARRIDAIVFGETLNTITDSKAREAQVEIKKYALVMELKAWREEEWGGDGFDAHYGCWKATPDWRLRAFPKKENSGFYPLEHPHMQVLSYRNFLKNFHSAASNNDWWLEGTCFLSDIDDYRFLHIDANGLNEGSDRFLAARSKDDEHLKGLLGRMLGSNANDSRGEVAASDFACDEFLQGTYMVPMSLNREGSILNKICLMTALLDDKNEKHFEADPRISIFKELIGETLATILETGINGSIDNKKWLVLADAQKVHDECTSRKVPTFINHADISMGLLCALLQTGYPYVSMQTNHPALQDIVKDLKERFDLDPKSPDSKIGARVRFALQEPLGIPIDKVSYFNVFNAYKWERAVCTTIGIVDLCDSTREQAQEMKSLKEFLQRSTDAKLIFLLVDDKTTIAKELQEKGDPFADFTIINWPKE